MSNDNALGTALWLAVGGAAGYAAGRWIVGPHLPNTSLERARAALPRASSSSSLAATLPAAPPAPMRPTRPTRALVAGPSGHAMPIDPYGPSVGSFATTPIDVVAGPSGDMRPIDPYADGPPSISVVPSTASTPIVVKPPTASLPMPIDGPITMPSQLVHASTPSVPTSPSGSGPITRPSQIDARPAAPLVEVAATTPRAESPVASTASTTSSASFATSPRVRRFDPVFQRYRSSLPIEYVRALVERESSGRPSLRTGSAIGLMQIVPVVLADYNKRHGTTYLREHLIDPATNVAIGCELLRLIIASYRKHHPRIANLQADWNNPRFVELLTFGYNAGYSEAGGVGRVARYLEGLGALDITIDQVSAHAQLAGASKHLSNPAKVAWSKSVVALYQRERAHAQPFATS
jgi:hypothetical protein